MQHDRFKELLEELDGNSLATLTEKNARYSSDGDALHNFRSGADIMGGTPAQACWGYLTKHLTALRDMVQRDDFSNREDFLEKCQDTINYVRFLWCIGNETKEATEGSTESIMKNVEICRKRYIVYHKDNNVMYDAFDGMQYSIEESDAEFSLFDGSPVSLCGSFDKYYCVELIDYSDGTFTVRTIKK